jgi:transglutaminase-like putative cysteine protease
MIAKVLRWLWQRFRPAEGRAMFLLLLCAALSAALGAMAANWVIGDELFLHTALLAVLLGRRLGRTRMKGWLVAVLVALGGLAYVGWWVTRLNFPLWAMLSAAWQRDSVLLGTWLREAQARVAMLTGELATWGGSWFGRAGTPGPVVSLFWMALILWGSAASAGWMLTRRRHALVSFLPLGGALSLSVYLADAGKGDLLLFLACIVMMIPLGTLYQEQQRWDARQVPYPEALPEDTLAAALIAAVIFLISATTLPEVRLSAVVDWFWRLAQGPQQVSEEVLSRAFPGARQPRARRGLPGGVGAVLPREHLLGGSPDLKQTVVMLVTTDDPPPAPEELGLGAGGPQQTFYWRGMAYGEYDGLGWQRGRTEVTRQQPYVSIEPSGHLGRRPLRQEFKLLVQHGETLYAAGDPNSVNQAVMVRRQRDSSDLIAMESLVDRYQVLSLVPDVTGQQLAEVTAEYPQTLAWVYRSLPDDLPQRIADLAREATAEADTPYERALALEAYLRTIPYDLRVAKPPDGRDVVEYFLFELQRGYCDYFGSAMVVMARSVGIPARLAVGYAMGRHDAVEGAYVVTALDAHAWPELYFPGYGWIPFEPTPAYSPMERALAAGPHLHFTPALPSLPQRSWWVRFQVEARLTWLRWQRWVLAGLGALVAAAAGWRLWRWWLPGLSAEQRIALGYARLREMAPRLGVAVHPSDTPAEFAAAMQQGLAGRRANWARLAGTVEGDMKQASTGVRLVTYAYERISYAPTLPDSALMRQAAGKGWRLGWRLWRLAALSADEGAMTTDEGPGTEG